MQKFYFLVFVILCVQFSNAQPAKVVLDKVIAVVGDKIILQSDIKNSIDDAKRQKQDIPANADCVIANQAIISKALMLQALKDSLPLTDDEVEAELDNRVRYYINQFGSQEAVEEAAGKTIYQIKDDARESVREKKLAESMQHKIVDKITVTPNEVQKFYNKIPKDSLPYYESELEIGQIILYPKASRDLELYIIDEMNNYKKKLENKAVSFCDLAKQVSEDPGSKDHCGQYELNRKEKTWDPVFLSTAFRLKEGEISAPIKSKFGYHIIKCITKNGENVTVQHILRIPPVTDDEVGLGIKKLDTIRSKIIAGNLSFNDAAFKYSEDEAAKYAGPFIQSHDGSYFITIDQLDKGIVTQLKDMKPGDIARPVAFTDEQGKKGVRLVYLKTRTQPHRLSMKEDYSRIAQFALDEKKSITMEKWLQSKLPTYYISIDNDILKDCSDLKKYVSGIKGN